MVDRTVAMLPVTYKIPGGLPGQEIYFPDLNPGADPIEYEINITPEDVDRWARLHDDDSAWYRRLSPAGDLTAPPYIFYYASQSLFAPKRNFRGGGFARYRASFLAPVPIARPLRVIGKVSDKYIRRGRGYVDWEIQVSDADTIIQWHSKTWAFDITPGQAAGWPEKPGASLRADAGSFESLEPLSMLVSLDRMVEFEGPGEVNSHTSYDVAAKSGRPAPRAQGALSFGLLFRLMRDRFGENFAAGGTLDVRFIKSLYAGELLTARGEVTSASDGETHCRVWAENPAGETVTAGIATARS